MTFFGRHLFYSVCQDFKDNQEYKINSILIIKIQFQISGYILKVIFLFAGLSSIGFLFLK